MKECGILEVKTYSDPSYIFSGGQDPQPHDLRPSVHVKRYEHAHWRHRNFWPCKASLIGSGVDLTQINHLEKSGCPVTWAYVWESPKIRGAALVPCLLMRACSIVEHASSPVGLRCRIWSLEVKCCRRRYGIPKKFWSAVAQCLRDVVSLTA